MRRTTSRVQRSGETITVSVPPGQRDMAHVLSVRPHRGERMRGNKYVQGGLVLAVAALLALNLFGYALAGSESEIGLPALALGGVVLLLVTLALVSVVFAAFGLSDRTQALGLPEGSIRAVVALSLIVMFAILSVYLFERLATGGQLRAQNNLSRDEVKAFLDMNRNLQEVSVKLDQRATAALEPRVASSVEGAAADTKRYRVSYRTPARDASDDFAKQLLVMIGTLVTAVSSFYFGARSGPEGQDRSRGPAPILRAARLLSPAVKPGGVDLEIAGDHLNALKQVKIVLDRDQIEATEVTSNDGLVKCKLTLDATTPAGDWDVVVIDAFSRSASLPGAIKIP